MNKNNLFNSRKYIILLLLICTIFFVLVIKAFEYLPVSDKDAVSSMENLSRINTPADYDSTEPDENIKLGEKKKKKLNISLNTDDIDSDFEEIDPPPETNINDVISAGANNNIDTKADKETSYDKENKNIELSDEDMAYRILFNADKLRKNGEYSKALDEYQKATSMTNNS